ncbi:GtrA family protein [Spirochaetota bacterium]
MNRIASFIKSKSGIIKQILKFGVVGILNTIIDYVPFNIIMKLTGITSGVYIGLIRACTILFANINSYLLNKAWTFKHKEKKNIGMNYAKYLLVSGAGMGINVLLTYVITTHIDPYAVLTIQVWKSIHAIVVNFIDISIPQIWANFAAITATAVSLVINFSGYKFFVFRKNNTKTDNN